MANPEFYGRRILVVDDEPDSIEVVKLVLSAAGAIVTEAADGRSGLEKFLFSQPGLVLTDLSMPEMDGWELLAAIRKHENGRKTPVIALTAHAMDGDKERVMGAGFDGYMDKPLTLFTLLKDLSAFVARFEHSEDRE